MAYFLKLYAWLDISGTTFVLGLLIIALLVLLDWYVSKPSHRTISSAVPASSESKPEARAFDRAA